MQEKCFDKTERLYDDGELYEFDGEVLSCEAFSDKKYGEDELYAVILNRTAFFPEGGGQYGDVGTIDGARVIDTIERDGEILHIASEHFPAGTTVLGHVDKEVRFDRMQQHTGEHILCGIAHRLYGYSNVGFALYDDKTTMDLDGTLSESQIAEMEKLANIAVFENHQVKVYYPGDKASEIDYRCKLDISGSLRLVEIEDVDICACCAPHLHTTGEVGLIKIIDAIPYKGGTRLTILCGGRALSDYIEKDALSKKVSALLSVPASKIDEGVIHIKQESEERRLDNLKWQERYISQITPESFGRFSVAFEDEIDTNIARKFVNDILDNSEENIIAAIFYKTGSEGYQYIMGSQTENLSAFAKIINEKLEGRGGGKPGMIQGFVAKEKEEIIEFLLGE